MFDRIKGWFHRRRHGSTIVEDSELAASHAPLVAEGAHVVHFGLDGRLSDRQNPLAAPDLDSGWPPMPPPMGDVPRRIQRPPEVPPLSLPVPQQMPRTQARATSACPTARVRFIASGGGIDIDADVEDAGLDQEYSHPAAIIARLAQRRYRRAVHDREEREAKEAAAKKLAELEKKSQGVLEIIELSGLDRAMITRVTIWQLGIGAIISTVGIESGVSSCFSLTATMFVASLFYLGLPFIHYEGKKDVKWYRRPIFIFGATYFVVSVLSFVFGLIPLGMGDFSHFRVYKVDNTTYVHNDVFDALSTFFCILNAAFPLLTREFIMELGSYITNQYLAKLKVQLEELKEQLIRCGERSTRIYNRANGLIDLLSDAINGVDRDYVKELKELKESREHAQHVHGCGFPTMHAGGECSYRRASQQDTGVTARMPIIRSRDLASTNPYAALDGNARAAQRDSRGELRTPRPSRIAGPL